jgi:HAD superfamily hydrolase (TIGR01484 family)
MTPLCAWPSEERRHLMGVFTDIDDTLTTRGAITPDALHALADLKAAGLHVIPITGRPIGWSEPFARGAPSQGITPWPVDAIVAENGAVAFAWQSGAANAASQVVKAGNLYQNSLQCFSDKHLKLSKLYQQEPRLRASNFAKMQAVAAQVLLEMPQAKLSQDSPGRETDMAFDHSEFTHLSAGDIARVVALMQAAGMTATVSSIHINGWFGTHNKLEGARWIVRELWGRALDDELNQWAYVGDSTNDQVMFEHFEHSIGVANVRRFETALSHKPRYITPSERGAGFAEVARAILQARSA